MTIGSEATLTTTVEFDVQPSMLVPETVYVVVIVGLAVTLVPVDALNVLLGLHVYVFAPVTVNRTPLPIQMPGEFGVIEITGKGLTITTTV